MNKLILVLKTPGYTETILEFSIAQEGMLEAEKLDCSTFKICMCEVGLERKTSSRKSGLIFTLQTYYYSLRLQNFAFS